MNLEKHIENLQKYGVPVIVALNRFISDTEDEISFVKSFAKKEIASFHFVKYGKRVAKEVSTLPTDSKDDGGEAE